MDQNLLLTEQEIENLKQTKSASEWNKACDAIKQARNGQYPRDWWTKMMMSGLITQISNSWKK